MREAYGAIEDGTVAPSGLQRILTFAFVLILVLASPGGAASQAVPADTYATTEVEALVRRARLARQVGVEGIDSYEAKLQQRIYVGLTALRFRRERGLFEHERIARVRWSADGNRVIQWEGLRTAIPIAGLDTGNPEGGEARLAFSDSSASISANAEFERDMAEELLDEVEMPAFDFDPGGDRISFGSNDEDGDLWALNPLADTAAAHYRYHAGDTLTVALPVNERAIVLHEIRVEPRRADFRLVAGSLWFDAETAALVRATYKPARPIDLAVSEPGDGDDVPGFLQPLEADIDYVTVEYSLQDFEFWMPRRFAFEGEARLGSLARVPITMEWSLTQYRVNEPETELLATGDLPEGWRRQENVETDSLGNETSVVVVVPTVEELRESPDLSEDFGARSPGAFTESEVRALEAELDGLLPSYNRFRPRFAWGLGSGLLRYNRAEGLSVGASTTLPLAPSVGFEASARFATGSERLYGSGTLLAGPDESQWSARGYHELRSMSEILDPFDLKSSLSHAVLGNDHGEYLEASGASLGFRRLGDRTRFSLVAFTERHRPVQLAADFSLRAEWGDVQVQPLLQAERVELRGARGGFSWFHGLDPNGLVMTGALQGEAATGDASYQRVSATLTASHPLPLGLAGAFEVSGGSTWGDSPVQRSFFLGGTESVRGYDTNVMYGESYWAGRAEIATGFAAARLSLFTDLGWAGDRGGFDWDERIQGAGVGASLLDGIFRLDLARSLRGPRAWKLHAYLDGLF